MTRRNYWIPIAQVCDTTFEIAAVIMLAPLIPIVIVGAALLAVWGDISGERNRWTGLDLPKE